MASSLEYVQYAADQLSGAGTVSYKKMFGEYGLYCGGKYFACICDDRLLIKITQAGQALMPDGKTALPYPGGSPMFLIEEIEDREFLARLVSVTCAELPIPKSRKPKRKKDDELRG